MREFLGASWKTLLLAVAMTSGLAVPAGAGGTIVVQPGGVEPPVLRVSTGERVAFVNRTGRPVHIQFAGDPREHRVVQIPVGGPIWAVFYRAGAHPFVVHVGDVPERALRGTVEAVASSPPSVEPPECSVLVMDVCVEP